MPSLRLAVVVPFLDEQAYLGQFLASIEAQTRPADLLVLLDDGSSDGSREIAVRYADRRPAVSVVHRAPRPRAADRLADAPEFRAFQEVAAGLSDYDIIAKVDADLDLRPETFALMEEELLADHRLGIVGTFLSVTHGDHLRRERRPVYHVRGATKFYRRACYDTLVPIPAILGWDTIDEVTARMHGWRTRSVAVPGGDPVHLRPTGSVDGVLRAYTRGGECSAAAGYHPLWVVFGATKRALNQPFLLGGAAYLFGWVRALLSGVPRADPTVRGYLRREQITRVKRALDPRPDHSM